MPRTRRCHHCAERSETVQRSPFGTFLCAECERELRDSLSRDPANEAVHLTDMKFVGGDGVARPWKGGGSDHEDRKA